MAYSPAGANWEVGATDDQTVEKALANYCLTNNVIDNSTADPQAALDAKIHAACSGNLAALQTVCELFFKVFTFARKKTRP